MKPKSAIEKGKHFEKWTAHEIELAGLGESERRSGSGNGLKKGDVRSSLPKTIECKNEASFPKWLLERIEQAERQTLGYQPWVLVLRDPRSPRENYQAFAVLAMHEWLELEKKAQEPKTPALAQENKELRYKLQNAIRANKDLLKSLEE